MAFDVVVMTVSLVAAPAAVVVVAVVVFVVAAVAFLPQSCLSLYSEGSRYEKQVVQLETYDLIA